MDDMLQRLRLPLQFLAAVLLSALLASLWESQRNLAAIAGLGHDITMLQRLSTFVHDLVGFGPAFAALGGVALLLGFIVAALLSRKLPAVRMPLYLVAGGASIATMLAIMDMVLGITVIASARDVAGVIGLATCGAAGGIFFAWLRRPDSQNPSPA